MRLEASLFFVPFWLTNVYIIKNKYLFCKKKEKKLKMMANVMGM